MKQAGLTLIELLVAASITVLLLTLSTSVLVTFVSTQVAATRQQNLRESGESALEQVLFQIRNSRGLLANDSGQICSQNMEQLRFQNTQGEVIQIQALLDQELNLPRVAYRILQPSDTWEDFILTDGDAYLIPLDANPTTTPIENTVENKIEFDCQTSQDGEREYVSVRFFLRAGNPAINTNRELAWQEFVGGVSIRN